MSDISRLLAESKKIDLDGVEVEVYSLSVREFIELSKLGDNSADIRGEATKSLIKKALKKSFPDATDEQIEGFAVKYLGKYLAALFEVSGLETDKKKLDEMMAAF